MDWLLLAALGIIWAAFLIPSGTRKKHSPNVSVEEFEHNMDLLADTERGRWVITPRKGVAFIGARARERARVRERRRRVLTFLLEATGLAFLIGLFPPLHGVWLAAGGLGLLTIGYIWLLLRLKQVEYGVPTREQAGPRRVSRYRAAARNGYEAGRRYVAEPQSRMPKPSFGGLTAVSEGDDELVQVFVTGDPVRA